VPRVAIVHDWLNQYGGAERVLEVLHELFPQAPVYTSMYEPAVMPDAYRRWDIRTSFMQHLPLVKRHHQPFMPLYPFAFDGFDLAAYDLVISNSSAFCHCVVTRPDACHVNYCLTPTRFLWGYHAYAARERIGGLGRAVLPFFVTFARLYDATAAARVDHFVAISTTVARRIAKTYRRSSTVIHPPIDCAAFTPERGYDPYFLVVSRMIPYKRVDLAVRACTELGLPLKVAGGGRDLEALRAIAGPTVEFLGRVPDAEVRRLYARCQAFLFPGEEDFGLTPLEAQASGRPVVAYAAGGALDTVRPGETGELFEAQTVESLKSALRRFDPDAYDSAAIRAHAERFDVTAFKRRFLAFIADKTGRGDEVNHKEHKGRQESRT
jgi:glycosyltransferase involved in cell wall biosynthesis